MFTEVKRRMHVLIRLFFFLRSSPLFRAFYIPFISDHHTTYRRYMILKARRQKQPRKRAHGWHLVLILLPILSKIIEKKKN